MSITEKFQIASDAITGEILKRHIRNLPLCWRITCWGWSTDCYEASLFKRDGETVGSAIGETWQVALTKALADYHDRYGYGPART